MGRYELYSAGFAHRDRKHPMKPIGVVMKLSELVDLLEEVAYGGFTDWYVKDTLKGVYVDPATVRRVTNVTIKGDGYPACPCCDTMGMSHEDHTRLPNCLIYKQPGAIIIATVDDLLRDIEEI